VKTELTLTWVHVTAVETTVDQERWRAGLYHSREGAENAIAAMVRQAELVGRPEPKYEIEERSRTFRLHQRVAVRAFGAWREGTVVGLGRTKVKITYIRNRQGTRSTKSFGISDIKLT
jgi:hypothetical protein